MRILGDVLPTRLQRSIDATAASMRPPGRSPTVHGVLDVVPVAATYRSSDTTADHDPDGSGSHRHEDGGGEGEGHAGDLEAGEALVQDDPGEDDGADGVERGQDGHDADQALSHGEEVEDVGQGVEGAGGGGERAAAGRSAACAG